MARGYYRDQVENAAGDVLAGAQVLVVTTGTSSPTGLVLYAADEPDEAVLSNPLYTDAQGEFSFWHSADGAYDVLVTCSGFPMVRETIQLVIPSGSALLEESIIRSATDQLLLANITSEASNRTAADTAHAAAVDPHAAYLTPAEGDARYDASGAGSAGLAAHVAAADPHAVYLTQAEAGALYDVAGAAAAGDTAHTAAADPHPTYLTQAEADVRYPLKTGGAVDTALRTYIQTIMATLDPTGPPPPAP